MLCEPSNFPGCPEIIRQLLLNPDCACAVKRRWSSLARAMFSVVGQTRQVPSQFDLSMKAPTPDSFELEISVLADRMVEFKALKGRFATVEAIGVWRPKFLAAPLKARRPPDRIGIVQTSVPGKT